MNKEANIVSQVEVFWVVTPCNVQGKDRGSMDL